MRMFPTAVCRPRAKLADGRRSPDFPEGPEVNDLPKSGRQINRAPRRVNAQPEWRKGSSSI